MKGKNVRGILLPVVLGLLVIGALAYDLYTWTPHGDITSVVASLGCGVYALVSAIRNYRRKNWRCFVAAVVLLAVCALIGSLAMQIPFCPECDGGVKSPLMRNILADQL